MDGPREDHTKWSKPKTTSYDITYTRNQKGNKQNPKQMNVLTKQKETKQTCGYQRERGGKDKLGVWD